MTSTAARMAFAGLLAVVVSVAGCTHVHRACAPASMLNSEALVDLAADAEHAGGNERATMQAALKNLESDFHDEVAERRYNVLALSGGGSYGSYSAGVLNGWTASGQRPQFDIVSGVSTGALIA